jgi:3-phenylpropionate/cinnamic acid dioxygenase small subunit
MNTMNERIIDLLYREAAALDEQRWDDWLALFLPDCEYWVPAWKEAHEPTADPQREVSLIYYASRAGLEDRVWRVRSGRSVASRPLPRTQHAFSNIRIEPAGEGAWIARANWTVHAWLLKSRELQVLFGRSEYRLVEHEGDLRIARRKSLLLNDLMPAMLDFYHF